MCKHHGTHVDVRGQLFRDPFSPCGPRGLNSLDGQAWQQAPSPLSHLAGLPSDLLLQLWLTCLRLQLSEHGPAVFTFDGAVSFQHLLPRHSAALQSQPTRKEVPLGVVEVVGRLSPSASLGAEGPRR